MDSDEFKNIKVDDKIMTSNTNLLDIKPADWDKLLKAMDSPVEVQKEVAAKMKLFIDHQMVQDMREFGKLTESTRKWLCDYTTLLSSLHKDLHGTKVSADINMISHAAIASKIRQASKVIDVPSPPEDKKEGN